MVSRVQHDEERGRQVSGQMSQESPERLDAAHRGANDHDVTVRPVRLRLLICHGTISTRSQRDYGVTRQAPSVSLLDSATRVREPTPVPAPRMVLTEVTRAASLDARSVARALGPLKAFEHNSPLVTVRDRRRLWHRPATV